MEALTLKAQAASNITILPYHEALSLLKNSANPNKQCQGALVFDHVHQRKLTFRSRAVVLASGSYLSVPVRRMSVSAMGL